MVPINMFLMAKSIAVIFLVICLCLVFQSCTPGNSASPVPSSQPAENKNESIWSKHYGKYPKLASWLGKKDEIIAGKKPYDLVMTAWFTPEEAALIKNQNPDVILLAGLSINWVWDNQECMTFLTTVAGYGREKSFIIDENMYLHHQDGTRCAFGWASEQWGHEEIYAMNPENQMWIELITSFYKNVLEQPQHDGIIVDMVTEKSWCPEVITDGEWVDATIQIFRRVQEINTLHKPVIVNAGKDFSEIDSYREYMDGYLMENFMGTQVKSTFEEGLAAANADFIVIYAADTGDTGIKDMNKMRLGLTLSMMGDNTYFTYDFGPRDHGQAWWFPEYAISLGNPLGAYYRKGDACFREFEKGTVVASPYSRTEVSLDSEFTDVTTGEKSNKFIIEKGDGRIFIKSD
jgi:hypothetical protein